jgi:hypothetical protein
LLLSLSGAASLAVLGAWILQSAPDPVSARLGWLVIGAGLYFAFRA